MHSRIWLGAMLTILGGCGGQVSEEPGASRDLPPTEVCTDPSACCTRDKLVCTGDPDGQVVCRCADLWDCSQDLSECQQPLPTPTGGGAWACVWSASYVCTTQGSEDLHPGGDGWTCTWAPASSSWSCTSAFPPNPGNSPEGTSSWQCSVDDVLHLLVCSPKSPDPAPAPSPAATPPPSPKPGQECVPGQKQWCDGALYCGWGQRSCLSSGMWSAQCVELSDGSRPSTPCACYFFMFNAQCCETPDCVVPSGTSGQICEYPSGELCAPCRPEQPACSEPGGECVVLDSSEAFCSKGCSSAVACPPGYHCHDNLCVPESGTCVR